MWGPSPNQGQTDLFKNLLTHQLDPQHPLSLLARVIPWTKLEEAFAPRYGRVGLPSHPMERWLPFGCTNTATTSAMSV
jgi:hypothetical protein